MMQRQDDVTPPLSFWLTGFESESPPLEEIANYLRDLVFLHDRLVLWQLHREEANYSPLQFYGRYARRELQEWRPKTQALSVGSPFGLWLVLPAIVIASGAVRSFADVITRLSLLGPDRAYRQAETEILREQANSLRIQNRLRARVVEYLESDPHNLEFNEQVKSLLRNDADRLIKGAITLESVEEVGSDDNK
jgi:hypothetical protein